MGQLLGAEAEHDSWAPAATACQPRCSALAAEAQAFSTLKIGIPSMPSGRSTTWPRIISWPVTQAGDGVADVGGLDLADPDAGVLERFAARRPGELAQARLALLEAGHPRPGDADLGPALIGARPAQATGTTAADSVSSALQSSWRP